MRRGRVFAQAWGGTNTIARALMSIEEEFGGTDRWDEVYSLIVGRTVITSFGEQDDTFATYIRPRWPELEFWDVATTAWGYFAWDIVPDDAKQYLTAQWMRENVSTVGPIGQAYRVWGDGKQMAAGFDDEDYSGPKRHCGDADVPGVQALGASPARRRMDLRRGHIQLRDAHRQRAAQCRAPDVRRLGWPTRTTRRPTLTGGAVTERCPGRLGHR